jgi:hypothetical protein
VSTNVQLIWTPTQSRRLWAVSIVTILTVALIYLLVWPETDNKTGELWFYGLVFVVAPITGAVIGSILSETLISRYSSYLLPPFCVVAAAAAVRFSTSYLTLDNRRAFLWGCLVGAVGGIWYLLRTEGIASRIVEFLLGVTGVFLLLLLFDSSLRLNAFNNGPYLGAAVNLLHGGRPMLDAFSQYGMAYVLYAAVIAESGYSLSALAAFISAVNIAYFGALCVVAWKITSSQAVPFIFVVAGVIAIVGNYPFDINYTPSVAGMRFLPLVLLLVLIATNAIRKRWLLFIVASIASLWSAESCLYSLILIAGYFFLEARRWGNSFVIAAARGSAALWYVGLPCLIATAACFLWYGQVPDYQAYFELVRGYAGDYWTLSPERGFRLWIFHVGAYSCVLGYGIATAIWSGLDKRSNTTLLVCVAIIGVLQFSYFAGRSTAPALLCMSVPLIILVAYAFAASGSVLRHNQQSVGAMSVAAAALFVASLILGSAATKLSHTPIPRNLTLLRACLQGNRDDCSAKMNRIALPSKPFTEEDETGGPYLEQAKQAYEAINRVERAGYRAYALIPNTPILYFYLRRRMPWGLSNPSNDGLSVTLTSRAKNSAENDVREGDFLMIAQDPPLWEGSADARILDGLRRKFTLCKESTQPAYSRIEVFIIHTSACKFEAPQR